LRRGMEPERPLPILAKPEIRLVTEVCRVPTLAMAETPLPRFREAGD
jgi:hypothetical protein